MTARAACRTATGRAVPSATSRLTLWAMLRCQMLHNMEQEFDVYGDVAHGDLSAVTGWLREKVHQYGHLLEPAEVVRNACGTFDAHYYLDYLTKKYTELYSL